MPEVPFPAKIVPASSAPVLHVVGCAVTVLPSGCVGTSLQQGSLPNEGLSWAKPPGMVQELNRLRAPFLAGCYTIR